LQVSPDRDSLISNGYHNNLRCSQVVLSCHKHNLKWLYLDCIYRISYKIAKKANPANGFALIEKW